jgi:hypothetical protein
MPYSRLYEGVTAAGLDTIKTVPELLAAVCAVQRNSTHFSALADVLGPEITLGQMAEMEKWAIEHGHVKLYEPPTKADEPVEEAETAPA